VLYLLVLLLTLVACMGPGARPVEHAQGSVQDLTDKTVALTQVKGNGKVRAFCSGVWVSPTLILTAQHCVADGEKNVKYALKEDVLDADGEERQDPQTHDAVVLLEEKATDLAVLEVRGATPLHGIARVRGGGGSGIESVKVGEPVATMGHPYGLWFSYSSGQVSGVRIVDIDPMAIYIQTTAPTSKGNSGCGLFNADGELVGIAHAAIPMGQNLAFYIHARHIAMLLRKVGLG